MNKTEFTHKAFQVWCYGGTDTSYKEEILLRETKKLFISNDGRRFRKINGYQPGKWPIFRLDMSSIRKVKIEV